MTRQGLPVRLAIPFTVAGLVREGYPFMVDCAEEAKCS
jgi:hypothetical protein